MTVSPDVAATRADTEPVLRVRDLTVTFPGGRADSVRPVRGVSLDLRPGTRIGLVGESGSGKSLTALSLMRLVRPPGRLGGQVLLGGTDLLGLSEREMNRVRGSRIAMVYQDPMSALNPVFTVGRQIVEAIRTSGSMSRRLAMRRAVELLGEVGVPDPVQRAGCYPHEFSGGMRQRVVIAMALAGDPEVIIADEPTTALDVTTQARVIELLGALVDSRGLAVVLITHDLGVAASFCDEINVMYAGRIVERADIRSFYRRAVHPYSEALLSSICRMDADVDVPIRAIPGQPPLPGHLPPGCSFGPRCPHATDRCSAQEPEPVNLGHRREAECLYAARRAASGEGADRA